MFSLEVFLKVFPLVFASSLYPIGFSNPYSELDLVKVDTSKSVLEASLMAQAVASAFREHVCIREIDIFNTPP